MYNLTGNAKMHLDSGCSKLTPSREAKYQLRNTRLNMIILSTIAKINGPKPKKPFKRGDLRLPCKPHRWWGRSPSRCRSANGSPQRRGPPCRRSRSKGHRRQSRGRGRWATASCGSRSIAPLPRGSCRACCTALPACICASKASRNLEALFLDGRGLDCDGYLLSRKFENGSADVTKLTAGCFSTTSRHQRSCRANCVEHKWGAWGKETWACCVRGYPFCGCLNLKPNDLYRQTMDNVLFFGDRTAKDGVPRLGQLSDLSRSMGIKQPNGHPLRASCRWRETHSSARAPILGIQSDLLQILIPHQALLIARSELCHLSCPQEKSEFELGTTSSLAVAQKSRNTMAPWEMKRTTKTCVTVALEFSAPFSGPRKKPQRLSSTNCSWVVVPYFGAAVKAPGLLPAGPTSASLARRRSPGTPAAKPRGHPWLWPPPESVCCFAWRIWTEIHQKNPPFVDELAKKKRNNELLRTCPRKSEVF